MPKQSDESHRSGPTSGSVRTSSTTDELRRYQGSRWIVVVVTVIALVLGAGVFLLSRRHRTARHFTLPGWDDVVVGERPPRDVELTCGKANDTSDCHASRGGVPIEELLVTRRPDALGVVRVLAVGVDPRALATIKAAWGTPISTNSHGHEALWCSPDGKEAASLEEPFSATSGGNVVITDEPDTWLIEECARGQSTIASESGHATADGDRMKANASSSKMTVLDFVGSCPFCEVRGQHLFDLPGLKDALIQNFGSATWSRIAALSDGPGRVEKFEHDMLGPILVASQCMRHDCDAHNVAVFLSPSGSVLGICVSDDGSAEWRVGASKTTRKGSCYGAAAELVQTMSELSVLKSP